jgi:hypothetical protein
MNPDLPDRLIWKFPSGSTTGIKSAVSISILSLSVQYFAGQGKIRDTGPYLVPALQYR